jgi:hypothetical protein
MPLLRGIVRTASRHTPINSSAWLSAVFASGARALLSKHEQIETHACQRNCQKESPAFRYANDIARAAGLKENYCANYNIFGQCCHA